MHLGRFRPESPFLPPTLLTQAGSAHLPPLPHKVYFTSLPSFLSLSSTSGTLGPTCQLLLPAAGWQQPWLTNPPHVVAGSAPPRAPTPDRGTASPHNLALLPTPSADSATTPSHISCPRRRHPRLPQPLPCSHRPNKCRPRAPLSLLSISRAPRTRSQAPSLASPLQPRATATPAVTASCRLRHRLC